MKVLFDTCVLIDVLECRTPFFEASNDVFMLVASNEIDGFITADSVTDLYYLLRKKIRDEQKTRNILLSIFELFEIIDCTKDDCALAIHSIVKDYEDAIKIECALREDMDCIITRNVKDYIDNRMAVYTPSEYLELFF